MSRGSTPSPISASSRAAEPFFVIGDVHGCANELSALLEVINVNSDTCIALVGDYIDRGPDSKQVLDIILELSTRCRLVPLLGNHEAMFLSFLANPQSPESVTFIYNGGGATLASYADDKGGYLIPAEHVALLHDLRLWLETPDYFIVHGGVPDAPLEKLDPARDWKELLWTRNMRKTAHLWSKVVVHGHSPCAEVELRPNRINIDTGCVFDNRLSAIQLRNRLVLSVQRGRTGRAPRLLTEPNSCRTAVRFQGTAQVRLFCDGTAYEFETVNYSQTGMLVRWLEQGEEPHLGPDQMVGGVVGVDSAAALAFTAVMVRRESRPEGLFYGFRLLPPYGSNEVRNLAQGLVAADEITEAAQWAELMGREPSKKK